MEAISLGSITDKVHTMEKPELFVDIIFWGTDNKIYDGFYCGKLFRENKHWTKQKQFETVKAWQYK